MIFSKEKIEEILRVIEFNHTLFIGTNISTDILTNEDTALLMQFGINTNDIKTLFTPFEQQFYFGRLSAALGDKNASQLQYNDFLKYLRRGQYVPLTKREKATLTYAKQKTYGHIKHLSQKVESTANGIIINNDQANRDRFEATLKGSIERAIVERDTVNSVVSELGHKTSDWGRDLGRIAATEMQNVYEEGRAASIEDKEGKDAEVYKNVYPQACRFCIKFFTTSGIGSQPVVFKLSDLRAMGSNIGKKQAQWTPTLQPTHPWSITEGKTSILTSKGYKSIKDIEIGDQVLTHKGRFRKVLSTLKNYPCPYKEEGHKLTYTIYYSHFNPKEPDNIVKMTFTGDHKLLTQRGWVMVKKLANKDKLIKLLKKCVVCDKNLPSYGNDSRNCCSENCSSKYRSMNAHKLWESRRKKGFKELSEKISKKVKQNWEEGVHVNTLKNLKSKKTIEATKKRMLNGGAIKALKAAAGTKTSKPQLKLYEMVLAFYPNAKLEYEIFNKSLDIALPEYKIDIEFDGVYWHKNRVDSDKKRDELLKSNGWSILRYSKLPKPGILHGDIERIVQNHEEDYEFEETEIIFIKRNFSHKGTKLFDIEVEEDKSFVARGVVVHNCRCETNHKKPGYIWSDELGMFVPPKRDKDKPKKGIRITVGEKVFEV